MKIKNRWIYIVFVLVFLPIPVDSQLVSLSKLESGKYNFRFGYAGYRSVGDGSSHGIWLGSDLGFGDRTKVSANTIAFFSDTSISYIYESFQIVHITPLGSTGLDCFFFGDFTFVMDMSYSERYAHLDISDSALQAISITQMLLGGGGGLSKTFGQFTAFASLFYHRTLATRYEDSIPWYGLLSTGAEIEITQHIDLTGRIEGFYNPESVYEQESGFTAYDIYIGLNLH